MNLNHNSQSCIYKTVQAQYDDIPNREQKNLPQHQTFPVTEHQVWQVIHSL